MNRRRFLGAAGALCTLAGAPRTARATPAAGYERTLLLVELKGGNDALNTLVPFHDPRYRDLRPDLALPRERVIALDERQGLHPSLEPLMKPWRAGSLALVQGVGYPDPDLSHFRSMAIWHTASGADRRLPTGWLGRTFAAAAPPASFAADGIVIGRGDLRPLSAPRARTLRLTDPGRLRRRVPGAATHRPPAANPALAHVLWVEHTLARAAERLELGAPVRGDFPPGRFGQALETGARLLAGPSRVAALSVTLDGFDTHARQGGTHARLLGQLARGLAALEEALVDVDRWRDTLVLVYSEFGRRAAQNRSGGTDHGSAGTVLVLGGRVRGGLYGGPPRLERLDANGNPPFTIDYRGIYATILEGWWGLPAPPILGRRFDTLAFL